MPIIPIFSNESPFPVDFAVPEEPREPPPLHSKPCGDPYCPYCGWKQ